MILRIWFNNGWHNILPTDPIKSTRALQSFCVVNSLPPCIVKSQGGWYMLTANGALRFIERSLNDMTFENVYNLLNV